jgi:hypothetical protein
LRRKAETSPPTVSGPDLPLVEWCSHDTSTPWMSSMADAVSTGVCMAVIVYIGVSPCVRVANGLSEAVRRQRGLWPRRECADWRCRKASQIKPRPDSECVFNDSLCSQSDGCAVSESCPVRYSADVMLWANVHYKLWESADDERCRLMASGLLLLSTPSSMATSDAAKYHRPRRLPIYMQTLCPRNISNQHISSCLILSLAPAPC